ncbi:MAG: ribosome small subunit-dependent GTPase A [Anaerolineales bacterium]|nr:ribosome small subunit-dependent GTPase A [Anaerolineales bacterium]
MSELLRGRVIQAQSGFYTVEIGEVELTCQLRGRLKQGRKIGDIVAIGDWVQVSRQDEREGMIEEVESRQSMIYRMAPTARGEYQQVIIANPDQAVFVFSVTQPEPKLRMLDRFLVIAEREEVSAIIVANKIDLTGMKKARDLFSRYQKIDYLVFYTSVITGRGIKALKKQLIGKTSLFAGPSGAGKTSILNKIQPGLGLEVKEVSEGTKKGKHTTVSRKLVKLSGGGYVADTPGLKALDLWDITPEEVDGYFREINNLVHNCRFSDCSHTHEPGCAVIEALKSKQIHVDRYRSYLRMREVEEDKIPWF